MRRMISTLLRHKFFDGTRCRGGKVLASRDVRSRCFRTVRRQGYMRIDASCLLVRVSGCGGLCISNDGMNVSVRGISVGA